MADSRYSQPSFRPSRDGFAFHNQWSDGTYRLKLGKRSFVIALRGRCGGMSFAALDLHRQGVAVYHIAGPEMPEKGAPLARYIWRRQLESLTSGSLTNLRRFALWTLLPLGGRGGVAARTRKELGRVLSAMVAGRPVPLGLIAADRLGGLGLNHQVVAWGVERDEDGARIRIYDPNHPGRDDVELRVSWRGEELITETVGGVTRSQWRGLFVERYRPR